MDYNIPAEISYDLDILKKFIQKDPKPVLIFYGGEPMLCNNKIKKIMDILPTNQFNIQTNGLHLNELEQKYVNRFSTIFVSVDGNKDLTDFYRGEGVYQKVTRNINTIIENGSKGEIIARMTLME